MAAGPATLEVKVKGNHVKFATHHHSLDREINRSGQGGEVWSAVGKCAGVKRDKKNKEEGLKEMRGNAKRRHG